MCEACGSPSGSNSLTSFTETASSASRSPTSDRSLSSRRWSTSSAVDTTSMIVKRPRRIVICESSMLPLFRSSTSDTAATMPGLSRPMADTAKWRTRQAYISAPMAMAPADLAEERRTSRRAAISAAAAATLLFLGWVWSLIVNRNTPDGDRGLLLHFHGHEAELLAIFTSRALAILFLLPVAIHLSRALRARQDGSNKALAPTGLLGSVVFGLTTFGVAVALAVISSDYADRSAKTTAAAHDAVHEPAFVV